MESTNMRRHTVIDYKIPMLVNVAWTPRGSVTEVTPISAAGYHPPQEVRVCSWIGWIAKISNTDTF